MGNLHHKSQPTHSCAILIWVNAWHICVTTDQSRKLSYLGLRRNVKDSLEARFTFIANGRAQVIAHQFCLNVS